MNRYRLFLGTASVLLAFVIWSAISHRPTGVPPSRCLRLCWGGEPESFDPAFVSGGLEYRYLTSLFEGLVTFGEDGATHLPAVAERWDISEDGKSYTFHLRKSFWSNGEPLTARDFVYSWRRILDPKTGGQYAQMLFHLANGEGFHRGEVAFDQVGVKAQDDMTLVVNLGNPTPYFLDVVAFMTLFPVNQACVERYGDDWVKPQYIVCNGPFMLESWTPNYKIVLVKNPRYWDSAHVRLDRAESFVIDQPTTSFNYYETGQIDWLGSEAIPSDFIETIRRRNDFISYPAFSTTFLRFNVTKPPFDDVRVRRAFAMSMRKNDITEKILRNGEAPTDLFVPPYFEGYQPPKGLGYDPQRAKELLLSVYPDPKRFPRVEFLTSNRKRAVDIFEVLQKQWEENLGVKIEPKVQEWKVYLPSLKNLEYQIGFGSWMGDYAEPMTFIDMFVTGGSNNRTGWGNAEYDRLVGEAGRTVDRGKRYAIYSACEKMLLEEEAAIAPICYGTNYLMKKSWVKGIMINPFQRILLKNVYSSLDER